MLKIWVNPCDQIFIRIDWNDTKLSMCGVDGPKKNGDCTGGFGQIQNFEVGTLVEGWTREDVEKLREIWKRWHLNDMRSGCEHQRQLEWGGQQVEVVTYTTTTEAYHIYEQAKAKSVAAALHGEVAELDGAERYLLGGAWSREIHDLEQTPYPGLFKEKSRTTKRTHWTLPTEHPAGVLGKPCPVCGYKYGTAWLHEDVPADVIEWLASLKDVTKQVPIVWRSGR